MVHLLHSRSWYLISYFPSLLIEQISQRVLFFLLFYVNLLAAVTVNCFPFLPFSDFKFRLFVWWSVFLALFLFFAKFFSIFFFFIIYRKEIFLYIFVMGRFCYNVIDTYLGNRHSLIVFGKKRTYHYFLVCD